MTEASAALRPPATVMRLARLGAFHPTRISFARSLVRRMAREGWSITRTGFALDADGIGTAIYRIDTTGPVFWFVVFADDLDPQHRTDRVIAERWDASFTLTTAEPDTDALARLQRNIPRQEAGRCTGSELVLSRANKSVRLFEHVVEALASGRQPSHRTVADVGYLVRTTAVYGNGKFGLADLAALSAGGVFGRPFEAEMLCVYMAREFSLDWVEHIARNRNRSRFIPLAPEFRRGLGVGNATGLGMAPFLVGHPKLIDRWIGARETALARVRAVVRPDDTATARYRTLLDRAVSHVGQWRVSDSLQAERNRLLLDELQQLRCQGPVEPHDRPWDRLASRLARSGSVEVQELVNSLLIELHPDLVDPLEQDTGSQERMALDPAMSTGALRTLIERHYRWALEIDFAAPGAQALFWYRSAEKEEPRLGQRFEEPGAALELPIAVARDVTRLHTRLPATGTVGNWLVQQPQWRGTVRRVQSLAGCAYAEVRDNLIDRCCRPVDLLRCKLAMFGATRFDPKSNLWTRITLFQGAPTADRLDRPGVDDWAFAVVEPANAGQSAHPDHTPIAAAPHR